MRVEIRADSVLVEGYVNAVGRDSQPIFDKDTGARYIEQMVPGVFERALEKNDVDLLFDHGKDKTIGKRIIGSTKSNLELYEDTIGLYARAEVTDPDVIDMARAGDLVGWSFGFKKKSVISEELSERALNAYRDKNGNERATERRLVDDIILKEVSIIDKKMRPIYDGNSIETRAEEVEETEETFESDPLETRAEYITVDEPAKEPEETPEVETPEETRSTPVDADRYWQIIADLEVKS